MPTFITAIEIGSSKIIGAVGRVDDDRTLNILAIEEQPLQPGSVRYGCVVNVEEVSSKLNIVKRLLENNDRVSPMKITGAYVALGGRSLASHPAEASHTFQQETEITEQIVAQMQAQVRHDKSSNKEVLTSVPVSYSVDGKRITVPVGTLGMQIRARYNLIVCDDKSKRNIKTAFDKSGLPIVALIARILAVDSMILTKDQRGLGSVIVDFGAETTTVAVYKDNSLRYLSTIPMGSRLITSDLATLLNISQERAEELKMSHVNLAVNENDSSPLDKTLDNIDYKLINSIVRARASEIIANINYQIGQSHFKPEELTEGIVLIGRGARLSGFREMLQRQTNLKIALNPTAGNINIMSGMSVNAAEALDAIAVLAAAAKSNNLVPCLERPVAVAPQPEPEQKTEPEQKPKQKQKPGKESGKDGKGFFTNIFSNVINMIGNDEDFDEEES